MSHLQLSGKISVLLLSWLALNLLQDGSSQEISCNHQLRVVSDEGIGTITSCETVSGGESNSSEWRCSSLQHALEFALQLNTSENPSTCVSVLIPPGQHVIDSPVHLGSTSVQLMGLQDSPDSPPAIHCAYRVDVDLDRLFDLSYIYIDYTLYFNHSKFVSISNVDMFGCQFSLRLDTVGTVRIANSSFQ